MAKYADPSSTDKGAADETEVEFQVLSLTGEGVSLSLSRSMGLICAGVREASEQGIVEKSATLSRCHAVLPLHTNQCVCSIVLGYASELLNCEAEFEMEKMFQKN